MQKPTTLSHSNLKDLKMQFSVDHRIESNCFQIIDWPLSRLFLKNNALYPWLILIPRVPDTQEIDQLTPQDQSVLIKEIAALSTLIRAYFKPDKLNIATLGNIVPQLHVHIVARFKNDTLWPHSIWQEAQRVEAYEEKTLNKLLQELHFRAKNYPFF